jgi:mono/diheme cytochrome c family protein
MTHSLRGLIDQGVLCAAACTLLACADDGGEAQAPSRYFDSVWEAARPNISDGSTPVETRSDAGTFMPPPTTGMDGGSTLPSTDAGMSNSSPDAGSGDGGRKAGDPVRGRYLVHHVAACVECHTPRDLIGRVDMTKLLSGVECFRDGSLNRDKTGCLNTGNLTNHETGLKNRSDEEIKTMFLEGMRPNGKALHTTMPYWVFGNMSADDADAIVAYLRSVPGINHMVPASQPPFRDVSAPTPRWPASTLPTPAPAYADQAAASRGRYLAATVGSCIECHTPKSSDGSPDMTRAFRGGLVYARAELGLPEAFFPATISTANLTPHADGISGWTVADVVKALKEGKDKEGTSLCPPMPGGMGAFGGLLQQDAEDIGHYLLSLAPADGKVNDVCSAPF